MVSFKHENIMSLIGLCFDGDVPMIIMPFMSYGSVLDYVRQKRDYLYFTQQSSEVISAFIMQVLLLLLFCIFP